MLSFGFIYKSNFGSYKIIYDGNTNTLRDVADKENARSWWNSRQQSDFKKVSFKHLRDTVTFDVPILEGSIKGYGTPTPGDVMLDDVSRDLNNYIVSTKSLSSQLVRVRSVFLKKYFVVTDGLRIGFKEKDALNEDMLPDAGIMLLKEFIFGLYRFKSIKIATKKDEEDQFVEISQNFDGREHLYRGEPKTYEKIKYKYKGNDYETPIYGVYAPQIRSLTLGDMAIPELQGRVLQKRQFRVKYELGAETYLALSRGGGKSTLVLDLIDEFLLRDVIDPREKADGNIIYYYGPTAELNNAPINKLLNMNKKLRDGKMFKFVKGEKCPYISLIDGGEEVGTIYFLSSKAIEPGRGGRPRMIIVDEAAVIDKKILKIIQGEQMAYKIYISTISSETKRNRFLDGLMKAELAMTQYQETMDDMVIRLWKKYEMDKLTYEDIGTDMFKEKIVEIKKDMMFERPLVGMRYTIDDVEYKSQREKDLAIQQCLAIGKAYLLAEQYSEFFDESSVFNTERTRVDREEIPTEFEALVMSYDHADTFDEPVLSVLGLSKTTVYLLASIVLPKGSVEADEQKLEIMLDTDIHYRQQYKCPIFHVGDCGQAPRIIRSYFEDRGRIMDMALSTNHGSSQKEDAEGLHIIGKPVIVDVVKQFFNRGSIKIPDYLDVDEGIFEQLGNFQAIKNEGTGRTQYKASKGHDDHVHALCYGLFFLYMYGLKDEFATTDLLMKEAKVVDIEEQAERLQRYEDKKYNDQQLDSAYDELFGVYGS